MTTFVYFILPVILLILGLPIFVVLLLTSTAAILFVAHVPTDAVQTYMFASLDNFPLLAVPFFVLAGEIMGRGGIAERVVTWVVSIIGGVRGSLAVTTVASSELFGAMAHTSVGTVVAIGRLLFPSLTKHGYSERFAISLITSSGAVAVIIPPSIAMILYAMTAEVSAIKLFTAGILPSLLIGLVDAVYVMVYARIKMVPLSAPARWKNIWASTKEASWAIGTIVVISAASMAAYSRRPRPPAWRWSIRCSWRCSSIARSGSPSLADYRQFGGADRANPDHRHRRRRLFLADDHERHSAKRDPQRDGDAPAALGDAAVRQCRTVIRRQLPRTGARHPDPHAAAAAGRRNRRHQRHPLRHHHGGQSVDRPLHAAVRAESVRREAPSSTCQWA